VPLSKLDKPERFVLEVFKLGKVVEILKCWSFQVEFKETCQNINKWLQAIEDSHQAIRGSQHLKKALGLLLGIGNYLNGGTQRGQADGFTLEILETLVTTKDVHNSTSLLEYITSLFCTKYGDRAPQDFAEELSSVGKAINTPTLQALAVDLTKFLSSLSQTRHLMEAALPEVHPSSAFVTTFPGFVSLAEKILPKLQLKLNQVLQQFNQLLEWFGYTKTLVADITTCQFFGWIYNLAQSMVSVVDRSEKDRKKVSVFQMFDGIKTSERFGKKIGQGADPLASLAHAIKVGNQKSLRTNAKATENASGGDSRNKHYDRFFDSNNQEAW